MVKADASNVASLGLPAVLKREFRDAYDRRTYARACLLARRLLENPALVQDGRTYLERFVRDDPKQRRIYQIWSGMLELPVAALVGRLLADDEAGAALRDSAPVFVVIPPDDVRAFERSIA
jgi:hypothetical protein